ncbi:MAG: hypothetical protein JWN37_317 [Candidatus Nomurabacteria bacterium]|nr:hypothetical protein [Candidatus Nomurabacteria bacterium]
MDERKSFEKKELDEDDLERLLISLPPELQKLWREKVENLELEEAIRIMEDVLENRSRVKAKTFTRISNIKDPEIKKEVTDVAGIIENTFGDTDYRVGKGTVGEVYEMPYSSRICVKYLVDEDQRKKHGNTFREESALLEEMTGFVVESIRVPDSYFYTASENRVYFGMERIHGYTLEEMAIDPLDPKFATILEIVKKLDKEEVKRKIRAFLTRMHKEKKIVHRDVFTRNFMVDQGGNWFLIDFGKAREIEIGEDSDRREASDLMFADIAIGEFFSKIHYMEGVDKQ